MKRKSTILRQNLGIDISKRKFDACLATIDTQGNIQFKKVKKFSNTPEGFKNFIKWVEKIKHPQLPVTFTMESTGVYHEALAYFLHGQGEHLSVLLPNTVKKFLQSLNIKSKTDKIDARVLARMGVERVLPTWKLSSKNYRKLRKLTRERTRLIDIRTMLKSHLEAECHSGEPMDNIMLRIEEHIQHINQQVKKIEEELKDIIKTDKYISERIAKITTLIGVGFITAVTVIAEVQGFDNFRNLRQLWSYAGYDVQHRQSGQYKGKTTISKKGNSHIRRALYGPSMTIIRHSQTFKRFYKRLKEAKGSGMLALVAVQRKLLGLIYTLWKNNTEFIDNYEQVKDKLSSNKENSTKQQPRKEATFASKPLASKRNNAQPTDNNKKRSGEDILIPTTQDGQPLGNCPPSSPSNLIKIHQRK